MLQNWPYLTIISSFILFWVSVYGWGRLNPNYSLGLGAAIAAIVPTLILSPTQTLGHPLSLIFFVVGGWVVLLTKWRRPSIGRDEIIFFAVVGFVIATRVFEALRIQSHGDALYYHLVSAVKWVDAGGYYFSPELFLLNQSSWWDYLYTWPYGFFRFIFDDSTLTLASTQVFSQLVHLLFGYLGSLLILNQILKFLQLPPLARAATLIVGSASLWWLAVLAKNDWGTTLWFTCAVLAVLRREAHWAGLFFGLSFAAKWTSAFAILPFFIWGVFLFGRDRRSLGLLFLGFFLAVAPIGIRNYLSTGNPVFPVPFFGFGHDLLSPSFKNYIANYAISGINLDFKFFFTDRLIGLLKENLVVPLGLLVLLLFRKRVPFTLTTLALLAVFGFLVFFLKSGNWVENRLYGPGLFFLISLCGAIVFNFIKARPILVVGLGLLLSRAPLHSVRIFWSSPSLTEQVEINTNGGDLKLKIRQVISKSESILTTEDNEHFYLADYKISNLPNHVQLDQAIAMTRSLSEGLLTIRQAGYRYLLHQLRYDGHCGSNFCQRVQDNLDHLQGLVVLTGRSGVLLDLDRLMSIAHRGNSPVVDSL